MPPSSIKYRHLGRDSAHRQALLRNLVTSLIDHESIATTWPKAKEAQRVAEKLITLGKRNTQAAKNKAQSYLYVCTFQSGTGGAACSLRWKHALLAKSMDLKLIIYPS